MKKKYFLASVAILAVGLGTYGLIQWQDQSRPQTKDNQVAYIEDKTSDGKTDKNKSLTSDQINDEEGIEAEQIVVKITDQGYVTSHGDHYHYFDGKVPFDAIISEELIIRDPNYTLQEADIINEVKDGYIIKVEGKYYLYLKDAKHTSNVRSVEEIAQQKKLHKTKEDGDSAKSSSTKASRTRDFSQPSKYLAAGKTAVDLAGISHQRQGGYTTDDGYTFSPSDIIEDTGDAFIVPHGGHFHYIPKSDLPPAELAAAQSYWNSRQAGGRVNPPNYASSNNWNQNSASSQDGPVSNPSPQLSNLSKIEQPNPGLVPLQPSQSKPSQPSLPSLLQQLYALPQSQRYHEGDGVVFDPLKISRRTDKGVVIPHGDHHHFIPYDKLSDLEEKIARLIPIGYTYQPLGDPLQALKPQLPSQPEHEHGFHAEAVISKDEEGYVVQHGGHAHYFFKKDLTADQIAAAEANLAKQKDSNQSSPVSAEYDRYSRDASDEEKMAYISKTYGVPREAIKISKGFFVFNNPDQAYDPTHIHPYAVRKEHVRIPLETGNPELDFLNELYTTALRSGLSPYSIQVENGQFVIPHGDHNHYIRVQSKGVDLGLKNKLPALQSAYQAGAYSEKPVLEKVEALLTASRTIYADDLLMQRRIELALGNFVETMKQLPSNSTAGYLASLEQFNKHYIHVDKSAQTEKLTEVDKKYQELVDKIKRLETDSYNINKTSLLSELQLAKVEKNEVKINEIDQLLTSLQDYQDRTGVTSVEYLKAFYLAVDDARLQPELRKKVADLAMKIYKSQAFIEAVDLKALFLDLYQTKLEVDKALASGETAPAKGKTILDTEKTDDQNYKTAIYGFLKELYGEFAPQPKVEIPDETFQALFQQGQTLLERIKDSASQEDYKNQLTVLQTDFQAASKDREAILADGKILLAKMVETIKAQQAESSPKDQELYKKIYVLLMAAHKLLEEQNASDELFTKLDALFDKLADNKVNKEELLTEVQIFLEGLQHPDKAEKPVSDAGKSEEKDSEAGKSAETSMEAASAKVSSETQASASISPNQAVSDSTAPESKDQGVNTVQEKSNQSSVQDPSTNEVAGQ
ncbi:pneumococcal-type histidine triad protein [Streptococcus sinensis]|uniref:pneumococcal-type histidine triad protein n=1 Tax=Streptococcus sinensis TaxID=176090 RepID=UPI001F40BFC7|nr:pneumococcal-type histidine triad protein [Streptococcus sinensis]